MQNTYNLPMDEPIPTRVESGGAFAVPPPKLTYYQWTTLMMLAMMAVFSLPGKIAVRIMTLQSWSL